MPTTLTRRSLLAGSLVFASATVSRAHDFYDPFCCNDKDCQPVPDGAVTIVPGQGYRIVLDRLDHPMVTKPFDKIIPFSAARISGDDRDHMCVYPKDIARCLYVRPRGM